jgi:hypothetical protein
MSDLTPEMEALKSRLKATWMSGAAELVRVCRPAGGVARRPRATVDAIQSRHRRNDAI